MFHGNCLVHIPILTWIHHGPWAKKHHTNRRRNGDILIGRGLEESDAPPRDVEIPPALLSWVLNHLPTQAVRSNTVVFHGLQITNGRIRNENKDEVYMLINILMSVLRMDVVFWGRLSVMGMLWIKSHVECRIWSWIFFNHADYHSAATGS